MDLINLIDKKLKSDEIIDLFENYDVDVIYRYDRLYEGSEDEYVASIEELSLEFLFDEQQLLRAIFIHAKDKGGFTDKELGDYAIQFFADVSVAQEYAEDNEIKYRNGNTKFLGENRAWILFEFKGYSIHYEYRDAVFSLVTLQRVQA
ncbi:MAG: hypothetical protein VXY23_03005 [Pseudomonadota bacterium]|nr:hypothetical protein [Pseudomonadota bacterium]